MKLRDYQSKAEQAVIVDLATTTSTLIVLPTGGGKTIIFSHVAKHFAAFGRVLIIAHRQELVYQARDKVAAVTGEMPEVEMGLEQATRASIFGPPSPYVVASVQTLISGMQGSGRMTRFDPDEFSLVICDECVTGDTLVSLADGTSMPIRQIVEDGKQRYAVSYNEDTGQTESKLIYGCKLRELRPVIRVVLSNGQSVTCTKNHLFFTSRGWVEAGRLTHCDHLLSYSNAEPRIITASVREPTRRCSHANRRSLHRSEVSHSAFREADESRTREIRDFEVVRRHGATGCQKQWMGWPHRFIQYAEQFRFVQRLRHLLSGREENHLNGMAIASGRGRDGVVVYGRWQQAYRWRSHFNGGVRAGRQSVVGGMAGGNAGNYCGCNPVQAESLLPLIPKGACPSILPPDRGARYSVNAIQALLRKGSEVRMLRRDIFAQSGRFSLLPVASMPTHAIAALRESRISAAKGWDNRQGERASISEDGFSQVPHMRWSDSSGGHPPRVLRSPIMREGAEGENRSQSVYPKTQGIYREVSIVSIEEAGEADVYDISVEGNHNYFANGILVHNCHHGSAASYRRIFDYFKRNPALKILGVTATPDRSDKEALGQIFDRVSFKYEISDGIEHGWLVPISQRLVTVDGLDFSSCRTTAGDLNGGDLAALMEYESNLHGIAHPTYELAGKRKTLVFAASVAQAERLCEIFNRHDADCAHFISGTTDDVTRKRTLAEFHSGAFRFLVNCMVLTEGYDEPSVEVIAIARPTKSRSLYAQMTGRGTRTLPGLVDSLIDAAARRAAIAASSKPELLVLDFVGNAGRHKLMTTADVLGGKYSEVEIAAAKERALKDSAAGLPTQMTLALEEARIAIEKEKREAARRAEESRRAKLIGKAKYSTYNVDPFDVLDVTPKCERKWEKGRPPTEKQVDCLRRFGVDNAADLSMGEATQLIVSLIDRMKQKKCTFKQARCLKKYGYDADVTMAEAKSIIDGLAANHWTRPGDNGRRATERRELIASASTPTEGVL